MKHRYIPHFIVIGLTGSILAGCSDSADSMDGAFDAAADVGNELDTGNDAANDTAAGGHFSDAWTAGGNGGDAHASDAHAGGDSGAGGQDAEGGNDGGSHLHDIEQELFSPITPSPSISNVGFTTRSDGTPLAIVVAGGNGAMLNVINLKTNKNIDSRLLIKDAPTVESHAWGFETLSNRTVMITLSSKRLFGLNPDTLQVTEYSNTSNYADVADLTDFFWGLVKDENDTLYIASYHRTKAGGRVLTFDYKTKKWGDLAGRIQHDAAYVRSVAYENGFVYAGTGARHPSIYKINAKTGVKTKLAIDHHVSAEATFISTMTVKNNRIYARISNNPKCESVCMFDSNSGAFIGSTPATWHVVTRPGHKDNVYYFRSVNKQKCLAAYNPVKKTSQNLACSPKFGTMMGQRSWMSQHLFGSINASTGVVFLYDSTTGQVSATSSGLIKTPLRAIHSMTKGNNGNLYAGWYMPTNSIVQFNVETPTTYSRIDIFRTQPEGLGTSGDWILYGGYPGGKIGAVHSITLEKKDVQVIGHHQDRPYAVLGLQGTTLAAVGSVPDYGNLGGALTIYDVAKNKIDAVYHASKMPVAGGVNASVLVDLSPMSLAYKNNKLYVGTSVRGGLGASPTKKEAPLYIFDMERRLVQAVKIPIAGQTAVAALAFGEDGKLYGLTGSFVFEVNPSTLQVVRKHDLKLKNSVNAGALYCSQGKLYGNTSGKVFVVNAANFGSYRLLADGNHSVLANDGNIYYAKYGTIYRWLVKK